MVAERNIKPNMVEVELFRGKTMRIGKSNGKIYGGIVVFKEADPTTPVIWLGQKSYCITNLKTKRIVLFYDTLAKSLFKPKDMSNEDDTVDMVTQSAQNVMLAGREAQQALGIQSANSTAFNFALAMVVVLAIVFCVFLYLFYTHIPTPPGVTTSITSNTANVVNKATTTITNIGPNIVPLNAT